jgi:hypothetical protein
MDLIIPIELQKCIDRTRVDENGVSSSNYAAEYKDEVSSSFSALNMQQHSSGSNDVAGCDDETKIKTNDAVGCNDEVEMTSCIHMCPDEVLI